MSFAIGNPGGHFFFPTRVEGREVKVEFPNQEFHIVPIFWAIPSQLGEDEIIWFQNPEAEMPQFQRQPLEPGFILVRQVGDTDALEIQPVFFRHRRPLTGYRFQFRSGIAGHGFDVINVSGRPRYPVHDGQDKAADAVYGDRARQCVVDVTEKIEPGSLGR